MSLACSLCQTNGLGSSLQVSIQEFRSAANCDCLASYYVSS